MLYSRFKPKYSNLTSLFLTIWRNKYPKYEEIAANTIDNITVGVINKDARNPTKTIVMSTVSIFDVLVISRITYPPKKIARRKAMIIPAQPTTSKPDFRWLLK